MKRGLIKDILVHDPNAIRDIFTFGPRDVVETLLLNMDLKSVSNICPMNERLSKICENTNFRRKYFELHSSEILSELKSMIRLLSRKRDFTDQEKSFYESWSKIAGAEWDPTVDNNYAVIGAAERGYLEMVKLLLEDGRANPSEYNNIAIQNVAETGKIEMMQLLLKDGRVNPMANNHAAIKKAALLDRISMFNVLKDWYEKNGKDIPPLKYSGRTTMLIRQGKNPFDRK